MPALVLVPTPLQASRAARRLCDAQGGVLFGPAVTTLEALAPGLLAASGDRRALLPPLAERLLALEAGRAAGGPFAVLAPGTGLAAALQAALAELRRGEVTAEAARAAASELEGAAAERLRALAGALEVYEARLEALGLHDRPSAMRAAAAAVRRGAPIGEAGELDLLVLDGFASLPPAAWDLVAALAGRARRTRFHLPSFPERPDLSAAVEPLLRRVEALHELSRRREVEALLAHLEVGRGPGPAALLAAFGGGTAPAAPPPAGEVLALSGEGEDGEARLAARTAARLVDQGVAPGDLVVLHPSPRGSAVRLAAAFAEAGVPFATGRGAPLREVPAVRAALGALAAAAGGLDRRAVERLAASTYLAPVAGAAALPRLLDRAGALEGRVPPEAALRRRAEGLLPTTGGPERRRLLEAAGGLAGLARSLRPLGAPATAGAHSARLAGWLDAGGARRRAGRGEAALVARDLAGLSRLEEAGEQVARVVTLLGRGEASLPAAEWLALLEVAVDGTMLPAADEPAAGAVELWSLEEAPGLSARAALVLGGRRGTFTAAPPPEPLLREPERQAVNARLGRGALATAGARRADALHRAACAVAAGREVVALGWPGDGPGGAGAVAPLVAEALLAVGVGPGERAGEPGFSEARTEREALAASARLAREATHGGACDRAGGPAAASAAEAARALLPPPLAARAAAAAERGAIEAERREAVRSRRASPHAGLLDGAGLAALRARLPDEWSPTQLEAHARCPFRFLASAGLGLADPEAGGLDIDGRDEGSLLHAIMERWVAARRDRHAWPPADDEAGREELRGVARGLFTEWEQGGRAGDPAVWAARREAVLSRLDRILAGEAAAATGLTPTLLEHRFGGTSGRPPLVLEAGGEVVRLQGRIDRVDASPDRLLVVDYKNARSSQRLEGLLEPASFGVESFQVPIYLLAAQRELPGRRPSATYQLLKRAERLEPVEGSPEEAPLAAAVVAAVGRIRRGDLPIVSRDCEGCPLGAVCRFQGTAELAEGEVAPPPAGGGAIT